MKNIIYSCLFMIISITMSAQPGATISTSADCPAVGGILGGTLEYLGSSGTPVRHTYGAEIGGFPVQTIWTGTSWEIQADFFGTQILFYNDFASYPNPPALGTGSWIPVSCEELLTFSGSGTQTVLPVELVDFNVKSQENCTILNWTTASELNNAGFQIQRSVDGERWEELSFMEGKGTTLAEQSYTYTDSRPLPGLNYYRLKQIDFDGQFEYSTIISVEVERDGSGISLYPNPVPKAFGSTVTLALETEYSGEAILTLYDLMGRLVKTRTLSLEGGAFRLDIGLAGLPAGVYLAEVVAGREQWRERLVVE